MTREDLEREAYIYTQEKMVHYSADQNEVIEMLAEFTAKEQNKKIKALEKENAELKNNFRICEKNADTYYDQLTKAKEIIKDLLEYSKEHWLYSDIKKQAEQFLKGENIILEDAQVGNSPFDADKVFNKEMKAYPDETLGISDIHKYSHKLFDAFEKLEFRTTFNKAIQAFYLEEGLYVVRSDSLGKYQYTLVEASSEEMAIRKCM